MVWNPRVTVFVLGRPKRILQGPYCALGDLVVDNLCRIGLSDVVSCARTGKMLAIVQKDDIEARGRIIHTGR